MTRARLFAGIVAVATGFASMPAVAQCLQGTLVRVGDNQITTGVIRVRAGSSCAITHGASLGPMYETVIARQPQHGVARVEGIHRVVYTPARNYVGVDRFVYARRGLDMGNRKVVRMVRVVVVVYPPRRPLTTGNRR
jgi:hypothetical protein